MTTLGRYRQRSPPRFLVACFDKSRLGTNDRSVNKWFQLALFSQTAWQHIDARLFRAERIQAVQTEFAGFCVGAANFVRPDVEWDVLPNLSAICARYANFRYANFHWPVVFGGDSAETGTEIVR